MIRRRVGKFYAVVMRKDDSDVVNFCVLDTLAFFALAVYLILHLYQVLLSGQLLAVGLSDSGSESERKRELASMLAKGLLARRWEA